LIWENKAKGISALIMVRDINQWIENFAVETEKLINERR
jgi:hypothetical protein